MTTNVDPAWVNFEEAMARAEKHEDLALKQFVKFGLTTAIMEVQLGHYPNAPLDMLFLFDVLLKMAEKKDFLKGILAGKDLRWWDDE